MWRCVAGSKQVVCGVIRVLGKQNWFHAFVADGQGRAAYKGAAIVIHMMGETMTMRGGRSGILISADGLSC